MSSSRRMRRIAMGVIAAVAALVLAVPDAGAIPAFARKYRTSCQTCHIVFPAVTPFGEAYRLNGYRFPEGTDVDQSKDEPLSLGAEGYKKTWPRSVWPGEMPGVPPVSLLLASELAVTPDDDPASQFAEIEAEILAGGTMGETISFYGEVEVALEADDTEIMIERAAAFFRPWRKPFFNVKFGVFEPGLLLISNHRRLTGPRYWATRPPTGTAGGAATVLDNAFMLESPAQQGIEFFGVTGHRFLWNAGYVEGRFNEPNNAKDAYVRAAVKFGGLALDGHSGKEAGAGAALTNPQPWREKSVSVSAFAYKGTAGLAAAFVDPLDPNNVADVVQSDEFTQYGLDVQVHLNDVILRTGAVLGSNDDPQVVDPFNPSAAATDVDSTSAFFEADWVLLPWLVPAVRYESFTLENGFGTDWKNRIVPTLNFLIRANVKGLIAAEIEQEKFGPLKAAEYEAALEIAF